MGFFQTRKVRKQVKALLHQMKTFRAGHEDILPAEDLQAIDQALASVKAVYPHGSQEELERAGTELEACLDRLNPPKKFAGFRENFDVLVVAISVAMAFRAYFYQPFKIPTGSMQPTLYGIHSETIPAERRTLLDRQPLKFFKWLVTGESFHVVTAKGNGTISFTDSKEYMKPGYITLLVAGEPHYIPTDVLNGSHYLPNGLTSGKYVREGEVLWSGIVHSGDFVFVNRWIWNFRHPRRGEVMVFETTGVGVLPTPYGSRTVVQQGTHYIKRMMGLPNETLQIRTPNLFVNGKQVTEPERVAQISSRAQPWEKSPPYAGFQPAVGNKYCAQSLASQEDTVTLLSDQYYAMGDNSGNSFDSRFWGPVPEHNLLGPATFVYWPFTSPRRGFIR